jgi:hypothetical protein
VVRHGWHLKAGKTVADLAPARGADREGADAAAHANRPTTDERFYSDDPAGRRHPLLLQMFPQVAATPTAAKQAPRWVAEGAKRP